MARKVPEALRPLLIQGIVRSNPDAHRPWWCREQLRWDDYANGGDRPDEYETPDEKLEDLIARTEETG